MSSERSAGSPPGGNHPAQERAESGPDSPAEVVRRLAGGFSTTQILNTAARLDIAAQLADGPRSSVELARILPANPRALHRFLRMMVVLELLVEESDGSFGLSASGQLLRSDHPESLRDRILYIGAVNYPTAQAMLHSVQTGGPAFDHVFGESFFGHFARRPELGALFNRLMSQNAGGRVAGILGAWDFSGAGTIVDIGGGKGALLAAILEANPRAAGILFDTPEVIAEARTSLAGTDAGRRIDMVPGDLFRGPFPEGCDLYLLSHIIHDWDDARAKRILGHCRAAVQPDGRLLLIEEIMPARAADSPSTIANDFSMLLLTGGKERTEPEYRRLLESAGFRLVGITPFALRDASKNRKGNLAVLESRPV